MKILSLNQINQIQTAKLPVKENVENKNQLAKNLQSLPKNSPAEMLGRSQLIAFKGLNYVEGSQFIHSCSDAKEKEEITYDRETGVFTHVVYDKKSNILRSEEFNPTEHTQHLISREEDGSTIDKFITLENKTTTVKDLQGRETNYIFENFITGEEREEITEYDKKRKIINIKNGDKIRTHVINLETGKPISKDDELAIGVRFVEEANTCITENLITKDILKTEKFDKNGNIVRTEIFSKDTNALIRKSYTLPNGDLKEEIHTGKGKNNPLIKIAITSKNGLKQRISEFNEFDEKETKRYELEYNKDKTKKAEIYYVPNMENDIVQEEVQFEKGNSANCTIFKYDTNPKHNLPTSAKIYENNNLVEKQFFRLDGSHLKRSEEYLESGHTLKTEYAERNKRLHTQLYDQDGFLEKVEEYNPTYINEKIIKRTEYDKKTGNITETLFNDSEKASSQILKDKNGILIEELEYYSNGKTLKIYKKFNRDGSYTQTTYDKKENPIATNNYDKDGRIIYTGRRKTTEEQKNKQQQNTTHQNTEQQYRRRRHTSYDDSNIYEPFSTTRTVSEKKEEFLSRLSNICASRKFDSIQEKDWIKLAEILEIDVNTLKNLSKEDYRILAKKFHPDNNKSEYSHNISCILNSLNSRSK